MIIWSYIDNISINEIDTLQGRLIIGAVLWLFSLLGYIVFPSYQLFD